MRTASPPRRRHARGAAAPGDERRAIGRHVHAVVARPVDGEGGGRRVELHRAPAVQRAQVERDVAGRHLDLEEIGLVVLEAELAVAPGPHEAPGVDLHLEVAAIAGIELVAGGQRGVHLRGRPVLAARTPERHVAVGVAEPGRRRRGVLAIVGLAIFRSGGGRRGGRSGRSGRGGARQRRGPHEEYQRQEAGDQSLEGVAHGGLRHSGVTGVASGREDRIPAPDAPWRTCTGCRRCRSGAAPRTTARP